MTRKRELQSGRQHVSFITQMQSWFSDRKDGRYLALILAEIAHHHPKIVKDLLVEALGVPPTSLPEPSLVAEEYFDGEVSGRRADLAVYADAESEEAMALIEIKYYDKLGRETESRPDQLSDYVHWMKQGEDRKVLVLSRETLILSARHEAAGVRALTWTRVARILRCHCDKSDLVHSLVQHLEEEGIVMQNIDEEILSGFMKRLLLPKRGSGMLAGNIGGPAEFGKLLLNLKLLSAKFNPHFREAWRASGGADASGTKVASIDYILRPNIKVPPRAEVKSGTSMEMPGHWRDGGVLDVYARHALGSGEGWLRVFYGFWFSLERGTSDAPARPAVKFYASAEGDAFKKADIWSSSREFRLDLITGKAEASTDKLEGRARKHVGIVLEKLLAQPKDSLDKRQRDAITQLKETLRTEAVED